MFKGNHKAPSGGSIRSDKIDTLIASNVVINGDVKYTGGIQIDGTVIGNVTAEGEQGSVVRVTKQGRVKGEIHGPNVIINGTLEGDVIATEHLELASNAVITGNVHYSLVEMVMGAEVNGKMLHIVEEMPAKDPSSKDGKTSSGKGDPKEPLASVGSMEVGDRSKVVAVGQSPS